MEIWTSITEHPDYHVSDRGRVRNAATGRVLTVSRTRDGYCYVGLMVAGRQVKRMMSRFVCTAFVHQPQPHFDTPIHLDSDRENCHASNLAWRPRWFALKYSRQFKLATPEHAPLRDKDTGEIFEDCWPLVKSQGLLYNEIILATARGATVFPTQQSFEWVIENR